MFLNVTQEVSGFLILFNNLALAFAKTHCFLFFTYVVQLSIPSKPSRLTLDRFPTLSVRPSVPLCVRCLSPIIFEVGIPNLVCGYILGWWSVAYHFRINVTLTLNYGLVFRIIVSGAYLRLFEVGVLNLKCGCILR